MPYTRMAIPLRYIATGEGHVPGDSVAGNRGADYVKRLVPSRSKGTRRLSCPDKSESLGFHHKGG